MTRRNSICLHFWKVTSLALVINFIACDEEQSEVTEQTQSYKQADAIAAILSNGDTLGPIVPKIAESIELETTSSSIELSEAKTVEEEVESQNPNIDFESKEVQDDFARFNSMVKSHCVYCHGGLQSLHPELIDFSSLDTLQKWISIGQIIPADPLLSPVYNRLVFAPEGLETVKNMPYSSSGIISMQKEEAEFIFNFISSLSPTPETESFEPVSNFVAVNHIKSLINGSALSGDDVTEIMQLEDQTMTNETMRKLIGRWLDEETGREWLGDFLLITLDQNGVYDNNRRDRYLGSHILPYNNSKGSYGKDFEQEVFDSSRKTLLRIVDQGLPFNSIMDNCEIFVSSTTLVAMLYAGDPTKNPGVSQKEFREFITTNTTPADNFDWRLIKAVQGSQTIAWDDIAAIRNIKDGDDIAFTTNRCGFFNTLGYHFKNRTNSDNRFRTTVSQAFISGLNRQFLASDLTPAYSEKGIDKNHASQDACYSCHKNLDPMTYIFSAEMKTNYRPSNGDFFGEEKGFSFKGVQAASNSIADFAKLMANHPEFAAGWTERCYEYAGHPLPKDSDAFKQSLEKFEASNFNFKELLMDCLGSSVVLGQSEGKTEWEPKTLRKCQFCGALTKRVNSLRSSFSLGPPISNLCKENSVETIANSLPETIVSRGIKGYSVPRHDTEITYRFREKVCEETASDYFSNIPVEFAASDIITQFPAMLMSIPNEHPSFPKTELILLNAFEETRKVNNNEVEGLQ